MTDGLKPGWRRWRFDQMATNVNERVDDPSEAGVDYYVGLEHLDSDSLKIRRWGSPADVTATKLLFEPGDIIFGRRRAYQRKLGGAEWRGIASAHSLVLRAKPDVVLPEFLPFFMQSDLFMERAQHISVGSLSPTINWKTLAKQEFALPPLEEQRRMTNALTALRFTQEAIYASAEEAQTTETAIIEYRMRGTGMGRNAKHPRVGSFHSGWSVHPVQDLITKSQYGMSEAASDSGSYPMLRMMNVENGYAVENDIKFIDLEDEEFRRYKLDRGDVLFNRTNSYELVGRTGVYQLDGDHVFASYLVRLKTKLNLLDPEYLCAFLNAPIGRKQVISFATRGVSQSNVNASNLGRVFVPLPPLAYQKDTVAAITELKRQSASAARRLQGLQRLSMRIVVEGAPT